MPTLNYSPESRTYEYVDDDGYTTVYMEKDLIYGIGKTLEVGSKEVTKLKEEFEEQIESIQEAFDKKFKELQEELESERRLRAEAEKLNEHLQDEVSKLRGRLPAGDEQDSWSTLRYDEGTDTVYVDNTFDYTISSGTTDTSGTTLSSGWPDSVGSWSDT